MKKIFPFFIIFASTHCIAQNDATVREYNKTITTYPFSNPNPVPDPGSLFIPISVMMILQIIQFKKLGKL